MDNWFSLCNLTQITDNNTTVILLTTVSGAYFGGSSVDGLLLYLPNFWDRLPHLLGDIAVHLHTLHWWVVHAVQVGWEEEGEAVCVYVCGGGGGRGGRGGGEGEERGERSEQEKATQQIGKQMKH